MDEDNAFGSASQMPMTAKFTATPMAGVLVVETGIARDERGFFTEVYSEAVWRGQGFTETFVQDNMSLSSRGTLRGMHYQLNPHGQGKLVRVLRGAVFDVVVDLRKGAPTFGQWYGLELSGTNGLALWIPTGFAHGFIALEDDSLVYYKCTTIHTPAAERSLSYQCPKIGIVWPLVPERVTKKDLEAPGLDEAEYNFT